MLCQIKFNVITFFFSTNVYVCIAIFVEAKNVSCQPTECVISLLFFTHITLLGDASGHQYQFAYFGLLLRNSEIASSKTVTHPRRASLGTFGLVQ